MNDITALTPDTFTVTDAAVERVAELMKTENGTIFRVAVLGGGCSGFQYSFSIDDTGNDDDLIMARQAADGTEVTIVVDTMSIEFLNGSQLDYVQELIGSYFQVSNPNATASCGCGTSFAV
ncbi:MAG: iron-sulfur cluster insertion protein ErpA [Alphaproteobacteria bacterium]|nr:iron-sulfur cluster insertion protein ErpA [Alphaproteobacteria bacterium]